MKEINSIVNNENIGFTSAKIWLSLCPISGEHISMRCSNSIHKNLQYRVCHDTYIHNYFLMKIFVSQPYVPSMPYNIM